MSVPLPAEAGWKIVQRIVLRLGFIAQELRGNRCSLQVTVVDRVADSAFLIADLAFFNALGIFLKSKKTRQNYSFFFVTGLGSGKTLSELRI